MSSLLIPYISSGLSAFSLEDAAWYSAVRLLVEHYWSGANASVGRQFEARFGWTDTALFIRFDGTQMEPVLVADSPDVSKKTDKLWERDVCEIFIAPDKNEPRKYFEFEVAPTGEWLDLAIDLTTGQRVTDWDYSSGMEAAARIEDGKVTMAMKIPWEAFGRKPKAGEVWLGNIFRCVGQEPDRGYLAWQPTMSEKPNFHVPAAFGEFHFVD